ncbi:uncharacterized protein HMPREF1541_09881 [Cyphellophora europaea CBS 101466]|uniref:EF-hand domain-containing protein n=1 Tax=Cyphellophora europaea (strain CBS 101466) TaxID=1220924 RepID=W2S8P8_CYPE1|nr:uncharacterized protein HMPREF1541_09881 [Cyphellophora europaea CBS 101466]ETN45005.1 hypothetical protein HMPREF1541_09881 [Cyphellophora europaea CBS 101466]
MPRITLIQALALAFARTAFAAPIPISLPNPNPNSNFLGSLSTVTSNLDTLTTATQAHPGNFSGADDANVDASPALDDLTTAVSDLTGDIAIASGDNEGSVDVGDAGNVNLGDVSDVVDVGDVVGGISEIADVGDVGDIGDVDVGHVGDITNDIGDVASGTDLNVDDLMVSDFVQSLLGRVTVSELVGGLGLDASDAAGMGDWDLSRVASVEDLAGELGVSVEELQAVLQELEVDGAGAFDGEAS